jgi:hypothetical protein
MAIELFRRYEGIFTEPISTGSGCAPAEADVAIADERMKERVAAGFDLKRHPLAKQPAMHSKTHN